MNREQVLSLVEAGIEVGLQNVTQQILHLAEGLRQLQPQTVETYTPVTIRPEVTN